MGKILLFYKYTDITYPKQILKWQKTLCESLGLKGRLILAHEGINGTIGGTSKNVDLYKQQMQEHPLFADIDFKESEGSDDHFPRLRIVIKDQIVNFGIDPQKIRAQDGGIHISPQDAHALMAEKNDNVVILDCRNGYETKIGTFVGSIEPKTQKFRDFPEYVDTHLDLFKDKEVVMACTGGVRCERASAYLKSKGITKKVYQISGGIHRYCEQFPDGFFRGKNYVFDGRVTLPVTDDILSQCTLCQKASDDYTNCLHALCNKHFICCNSCLTDYKNTCSKHCYTLVYEHNAPRRSLFKASQQVDTTDHDAAS